MLYAYRIPIEGEEASLAPMNASPPIPATWRRRENLLPGLALVMLALLAWVYMAYQTSAMETATHDMSGMEMPQRSAALDAGVFMASWAVMMVAMMIPSALPLILLYRVTVRRHAPSARSWAAVAALVGGYVAVWTVAGLPVYAYSLLSERLGMATSALPGALLIAGGAYQFTALKRGCHHRCSNPVMFLMQHYRAGVSAALRLRARHGVDCLGCCLGLMVALIALGMMNLPLMLTAAVIIFAEKTLPGGHRLTQPLGVVLIVGGIVLLGGSLLGQGTHM